MFTGPDMECGSGSGSGALTAESCSTASINPTAASAAGSRPHPGLSRQRRFASVWGAGGHHLAGGGVLGDCGGEADTGGALPRGVHRPGGDVAHVPQQLRLGDSRVPCTGPTTAARSLQPSTLYQREVSPHRRLPPPPPTSSSAPPQNAARTVCTLVAATLSDQRCLLQSS